jgi:hypothetical protein
MKVVSLDSFTPADSSGQGRSESDQTKDIRRTLVALHTSGEAAAFAEEANALRTAEERTKALRATFARIAKDEGLAIAVTWGADKRSFRIDRVVSA